MSVEKVGEHVQGAFADAFVGGKCIETLLDTEAKQMLPNCITIALLLVIRRMIFFSKS